MNQVDRPPTETVWLSITGMSCGACAANVERTLRAVPGAAGVSVDLPTSQARVEGHVTAEQLVAAVERAGYGARPISAPEGKEEGRGRRGCC